MSLEEIRVLDERHFDLRFAETVPRPSLAVGIVQDMIQRCLLSSGT